MRLMYVQVTSVRVDGLNALPLPPVTSGAQSEGSYTAGKVALMEKRR